MKTATKPTKTPKKPTKVGKLLKPKTLAAVVPVNDISPV